MAKKRKIGRPAGNKRPINIYIDNDRADRLKELSETDKRTQSTLVEIALEKTYGI